MQRHARNFRRWYLYCSAVFLVHVYMKNDKKKREQNKIMRRWQRWIALVNVQVVFFPLYPSKKKKIAKNSFVVLQMKMMSRQRRPRHSLLSMRRMALTKKAWIPRRLDSVDSVEIVRPRHVKSNSMRSDVLLLRTLQPYEFFWHVDKIIFSRHKIPAFFHLAVEFLLLKRRPRWGKLPSGRWIRTMG